MRSLAVELVGSTAENATLFEAILDEVFGSAFAMVGANAVIVPPGPLVEEGRGRRRRYPKYITFIIR